MKKLIVITISTLFYINSNGQTVKELYNNKDYKALIKLEKNADELKPIELYMIGFAFFRLANDTKALEFYDKAIEKGYENGSVHFYKGLSLRYLEKYENALEEIEISLKYEPNNQEFMNEKGLVFYNQNKLDEALLIFEIAKKLPNTFPEPYYWIAKVYQDKNDSKKALEAYYEALQYLHTENVYYLKSLNSIGQLEFDFTKDYSKSIIAFSQALDLEKDNYRTVYKLIKSYNGAKNFSKADSLFLEVKKAYENGKLPKEDMDVKTIAIAEFEWNHQRAVIIKSLVEPKEVLDISFKVFLVDKAGEKVERRFVVEKTYEDNDDDLKQVLCEQVKTTGEHITYPYGWTTHNIPLDELENAVKLVLDGKMKDAAKSTFNRKN